MLSYIFGKIFGLNFVVSLGFLLKISFHFFFDFSFGFRYKRFFCEIALHQILFLSLGLIKSMLDTQTKVNEGIIKDSDDDIINKMADMSIAKPNGDVEDDDEDEKVKEVLDLGNPVFKERRPSSKIHIVLEKLMELRKKKDKTGNMEKAVVVSQWTSMLIIMKKHVEEMGRNYIQILFSIKFYFKIYIFLRILKFLKIFLQDLE